MACAPGSPGSGGEGGGSACDPPTPTPSRDAQGVGDAFSAGPVLPEAGRAHAGLARLVPRAGLRLGVFLFLRSHVSKQLGQRREKGWGEGGASASQAGSGSEGLTCPGLPAAWRGARRFPCSRERRSLCVCHVPG